MGRISPQRAPDCRRRGRAGEIGDAERGEGVDIDGGFTTITGLAVSPHHGLYVLEFSTADGPLAIGAGKLVFAKDEGEIEEILTGLTFPVGKWPSARMARSICRTTAPFSARSGHKGEILRVEVPSDED